MNPTATVVTSVHPPDDPRIREKSIRSLVRDGWDVTYVCPSPGPSDRSGVSVRVLRGGRLSRTVRANLIIVRSPADVTIANDPELVFGVILAGILRGSGSVVFDLHENVPAQLRSRQRTPAFLRGLTSIVASWLIGVADRVATITLAEPGYQSLVPRERHVFANLPESDALPYRDPQAHGVVYVGDVTRERGASLLLSAVSKIDKPPAVAMIGRCVAELRNELTRSADAMGIVLDLPGFLPFDEAWQIARGYLVGVSPLLDLPNYRFSLPTKVLEYRAVGLVTVASNLPGTAAAVDGSAAASLFEAGAVDSLASELHNALTDADRAAKALEEAVVVRSESAWDEVGFVSFYRSLLSDGQ